MNNAEIINLGVGVCTAVTAVISVIISVLTLRQNNKMIKNNSRPYIAVSFQTTNFQELKLYLVVKNYGTSGAIIESLVFSESLEVWGIKPSVPPFEYIKNTFIAPNQSIACPIDTKIFKEKKIDCIYASISYSDGINKYAEKYPLNYIVYGKNPSVRDNSKEKELTIISYTLQDMVEKQL